MWKKLLATIGVLLLVLVGTFHITGNSQIITYFITAIPSQTQTIITKIQELSTQTLLSIAGVIASVSVVIGKLWSKLTQAKQQVTQTTEQLSATRNLANEQVSSLSETIRKQETQIQQLQKTVEQQSSQGFEDLIQSRDEAQRMVITQKSELNNANAVIHNLEEQVRKLTLENEMLKPKVIA
jgi:chromosome segregation ATPase